jgi:holo-[acyl-carrier protein] synthase
LSLVGQHRKMSSMGADITECASAGRPTGALRVGTDLVQVSRIAQSIEQFGDRFVCRLFTADEIAYASSNPALRAERLAARFAAKEAAIKALSLADVGLDWRQIEVRRSANGHCMLALHGVAKEVAVAARIIDLSVSLSHEGDYASAVVVAMADC